jgi:hypothetical protein
MAEWALESIITENAFLANFMVIFVYVTAAILFFKTAVFYILDARATVIFVTVPLLFMVIALWTLYCKPRCS